LLSSHILAEVEKLCDRVTIIRGGRDVETGTLDELRHLTRSTVTARVSGDVGGLRDADGVHNLHIDGERIRFDADDHAIADLLPRLIDLHVAGLTITPPSLEELFMRHYGDDIAAGEDEDAPAGGRRRAGA
ncbi:MAG: ATP-binding protein DrrA1-3 family domain-containing protein, partial [Actinomycetaceae bacterium]